MCAPFVEPTKFTVVFFISEKLYNSNGRDLRRALFSLKQIFQVKSKILQSDFCSAGELDSYTLIPVLITSRKVCLEDIIS